MNDERWLTALFVLAVVAAMLAIALTHGGAR